MPGWKKDSMSDNTKSAQYGIDCLHLVSSYTALDGSIGAGKSTLLKEIRELLREKGLLHTQFKRGFGKKHVYLVLDEPVDDWTERIYSLQRIGDVRDESKEVGALKMFYNDMSRYGFLFQVIAFRSRLSLLLNGLAIVKELAPYAYIHIISERSLLADRIMLKNVYEGGHVTHAEWQIYNDMYDLMTRNVNDKLTGMIYVKTSPLRCHQRLLRRERSAEQDKVAPDYLLSLDKLNDQMVDQFELSPTAQYVERLNFDEDVPPESIKTVARGLVDRLSTHVEALAWKRDTLFSYLSSFVTWPLF